MGNMGDDGGNGSAAAKSDGKEPTSQPLSKEEVARFLVNRFLE